jgi:uncharacterized protein (TIGR02246 family)
MDERFTAPAADADQGDRPGPDEEPVRALYDRLMDGWNAGDGRAFAAPFLDDGHLVAFDGTHFDSRAQIAQFQQELFDTHLKGTRLVGTVTGVRFLGPHVALLHAVGGTIMRRKSEPAPERDSIQTLVAVRTGDAWELAAFQNTRIRPIRNGRTFLVTALGDKLWRLLRLPTDPAPPSD